MHKHTRRGRGASEYINTAGTPAISHTRYTTSSHTRSSHSSQLPPVNCELHRQKSPGAPCAEAAAERQAVCGRETQHQQIKHAVRCRASH